ncbi:hypothetical protein QAD02_013510 [Eretmocerus hayati]|uniref:Uncharacterized protein n=1 Tax=Eretmocerus hayati TaxID=131215 RepID=A0ACC2P2M1_9HYME|nr:hypothetical protein QAD02_013510 [Eretmocerus hayati]
MEVDGEDMEDEELEEMGIDEELGEIEIDDDDEDLSSSIFQVFLFSGSFTPRYSLNMKFPLISGTLYTGLIIGFNSRTSTADVHHQQWAEGELPPLFLPMMFSKSVSLPFEDPIMMVNLRWVETCRPMRGMSIKASCRQVLGIRPACFILQQPMSVQLRRRRLDSLAIKDGKRAWVNHSSPLLQLKFISTIASALPSVFTRSSRPGYDPLRQG